MSTPPTYHKIQTVYLRDPQKYLLEDQFAKPEFEWLADNEWEFTEKVDGTCARVWESNGFVMCGGKTDAAEMHDGLLSHLQETFGREAEFPHGLRLYGEGIGAHLRPGGGKYCEGQKFVLFDVQALDRGRGEWIWLKRSAVVEIAVALGVPFVPIIGRGTLAKAVEMTRAGFKSQWGDFTAEGLVARPSVEMRNRRGDRIITKIKHKDFRR